MPSFDIVSEVDKQELDNALNQARKELATRFDFKDTTAEILAEKDKITLTAEDAARLRGLREIVIGKLSKRGVDLAQRRTGRACDLIRRTRPAGVKNSAGPRGKQSQGNHPGDQVARVQSAKPVAGSTNPRHWEKERRPASRNSVRAQPRLWRRHKFQNFRD